ncbi:MAG: hypothetical protein AB7F86_18995 [Bdellovibrionales bacterium]
MAVIRDYFIRTFSCDIRSLAVLRMFLGAWVVCDVTARAFNLERHYSDNGFIPTELAMAMVRDDFGWSLNFANGSLAYQGLIFASALLCGVALFIGYRSQLASFLCYVLLVSIQNRFPMGVFPGDFVSRSSLLIGAFLPLGAYWSYDCRGSTPKYWSVFNPGTFAFTAFTIAFIIFTGFSKTGESWSDGTAVFYVLNNIRQSSRLFDFLLDYPHLTAFLTHTTVIAEMVGGFLLLSPYFFGPLRTLSSLAMSTLLIGFGLGIQLWLLPFLQVGCMIGIMPAWFWTTFFGLKKTDFSPLVVGFRAARLSWIACGIVSFVMVTDHVRKMFEASNIRVEALEFPEPIRVFSLALGLKNPFAMYRAPEKNFNGWEVLVGNLADGRQVNLITKEAAHFDVPKSILENYGGFRDRRLFRFLGLKVTGVSLNWDVYNLAVESYIAKYHCAKWIGDQTEGELRSVQFWRAQYDNTMSPERRSNFRKELFAEFDCAAMDSYRFNAGGKN